MSGGAKVVHFPKAGARNGDLGFVPDPPFQPIMQGDRGVIVSALQGWLAAHGFSVGKSGSDGIYGNDTAAAVKALQGVLNVAKTGNFDQPTVTAVQKDLASGASLLRALEANAAVSPQTRQGSSAIVPSGQAQQTSIQKGEETVFPFALVGIAAVAVGGLVFLASLGKRERNSAVAGEDYLDDLGREGEDAHDPNALPADFYEKVVSKEDMKQMMKDFSRRLADEIFEKMEARQTGGRRTQRSPGVEGLNGMTATQAMKEIKRLGMKVKRVDGEFRVAPKGLSKEREEAVAYYTNDPDDAVGTAKLMMQEQGKRSGPVGDLPANTPKGKMQACARQWRNTSDKSGTTYRAFIKDCMTA